MYKRQILKNAQLQDGQHILDAGCGFGGPSIFFAKQLENVKIEAITIATKQQQLMQQFIDKEQLYEKLSVKQRDYHKLSKYYEANSFDRVLFLESLGHANNIKQVIKGVHKILKPNGLVYIKGYVKREVPRSDYAKYHKEGLKDMSKMFNYNTLDVYYTMYLLRKIGFDLVKMQEPTFITDNYEVNKSFAMSTGIIVGNPKSFGIQWKYDYPPYVDPIEMLFQKRAYSI